MRLLSIFALCVLTGALPTAQGQPVADESIQARNKAVAMRVFDEIFNQGRFQVADEIYAPDFQNHGLHRSVDLKTDQDAVHAEKKAFPDLQMSVQEMVAERGQGGYAMDISGSPYRFRLRRSSSHRNKGRGSWHHHLADCGRTDRRGVVQLQ